MVNKDHIELQVLHVVQHGQHDGHLQRSRCHYRHPGRIEQHGAKKWMYISIHHTTLGNQYKEGRS